MARRKCSVETYSSLKSSADLNAVSKTPRSLLDTIGSADAPPTFEYFAISAAVSVSIVAGFSPSLLRIGVTIPPSWRSRASRRCSGVTSGLPAPRERFCASATASCALTVSLLKFMTLPHIESNRLRLLNGGCWRHSPGSEGNARCERGERVRLRGCESAYVCHPERERGTWPGGRHEVSGLGCLPPSRSLDARDDGWSPSFDCEPQGKSTSNA